MRFVFIIAAMLLSIACSKEKPKKPVLLGEDKVLAMVNGAKVTAYDLELRIKGELEQHMGGKPNKATRKKILDALVQTKLLSQVQEKKLSNKEAAQLEKLVSAYREKLLVKMYLNKSPLLKKVSDEEIRAYYETHQEEFGASSSIRYEMLMTQRSLAGSERKAVLEKLQTAEEQNDWRAWAQAQNSDDFPVVYRRGTSNADSLQRQLRNVVMKLDEGKVSAVTLIKGQAYLLRAVAVQRITPTPLPKVAPRIRTVLETYRTKEALEKAIEKEMKDAKVKYL